MTIQAKCFPKGRGVRGAIILFALAILSPLQSPAVTGRTVNAKTDFGAAGNGTNDDTVALQNALNYLSTNAIKDAGVCLYLPQGTYRITDRLTFTATNPAGYYQGVTIRGDGKSGSGVSRIYSAGTNGALCFNVTDKGGYNFRVLLQDLQFQAGAADAGAAIEVAKLVGTNLTLNTTPCLFNVSITNDTADRYFTYGFKTKDVVRPDFIDVDVTGNRPGMLAGILLQRHYSYDVFGCTFSDADTAIDTTAGGEGNDTAYTVITNVNTGIRMTMDATGPSNSGGSIHDSKISAYETGASVDTKGFFFVNNNVFSGIGTASFTNLYFRDVQKSIISDNTFTGGTNQWGVVLAGTRTDLDYQDTVAYNTFGSFAAGVSVGTNVSLIKIIDNTGLQSNIVDNGINTYIVHGAMRPFLDTPARYQIADDLRRTTLASAPVINVADYGAKGDGVADDTPAITNALAQLKSSLNSSGQGTLYFPAGRYNLSKRLDLSQAGADWQKITICGDGSYVSVIEATTTNGVFKITCTGQVPARICNIGLDAGRANSGTAIELTQQSGASNSPRSLIMHDVRIDAVGNAPYFKTGVSGQGLVRPLLKSVWVQLCDFSGATGVRLTGGYGFDWQGGRIGQVDTACSIDSLGGDIVVRGSRFCSGAISTGLTVNAGGGTFALNSAHINALNNLIVSNASEVSYMNAETLGSSQPYTDPRTMRFSGCTNIYIRDNALAGANVNNRAENIFVMLEGDGNRNADISGNILRCYSGSTGFSIAQGSANVSVYDNRFLDPPPVDIINNEPSAEIALLPMEYRPELVGFWDLDEGSNSTVYGRNYLRQGTVSGAVWTNGQYGTGLHFNGTSDSVTLIAPQFADVTNNFTLMAWVKPEKNISGGNQSGGQSYVISGGSPDTNANHVAVMLSAGTNGVRVVENGTSATT
ncbi:MAG: glycosyl hydrolase family 28-related protein, partial [Kiritimatiellales bacterium]